MPRSYLHTVRKVDFQIEGLGWLDVVGFSMTLEPNSIPTAVIEVALAGGGKSATKTNRATVYPFSLGMVNSDFNKVLKMSAQSARCNFDMTMDTVRLSDGKKGTQEISLKGWVLASAGLGSVTTVSGLTCTCTIAHPIYLLAMHGGFCTNFNERLGYGELAEDVTDPINAGKLIYGRIIDVQEELEFVTGDADIKPGGKSPSDIMDDVKKVFSDIPDMIDRYLEWDPSVGAGTNGIPYEDLLTDRLLMATKVSMLESWVPIGVYSVWDILVNCVCADFDLAVIPDYTKERLKVGPYYPWLSPSMEINEDDAAEIVFPGVDPAPIYGVCASPQMEEINSQYPSIFSGKKEGGLENQATVIAYVPEGGAEINGKFFSGALPEWLSTAIAIAPGLNEQPVEPKTYSEKEPEPQESSSGDNEEAGSATDMKMACLASQFLKGYKKRLEATVNCPLLFSRNGEDPFLPGGVLAVRNEDGVLIKGYVASMTHTISMDSGNGVTSFHLAYCQPDGGYDILKDVMDKNPMYS